MKTFSNEHIFLHFSRDGPMIWRTTWNVSGWMILEGCEGTSLPGGPVVKNLPAEEAGDRVFSIDR